MWSWPPRSVAARPGALQCAHIRRRVWNQCLAAAGPCEIVYRKLPSLHDWGRER
jgi:hypothetical protein